VKPMGFYVIEDFAVAYDEGRRENQAPQWPMLKTLVDDTLHRYTHSFTPAVASLHMYGEIAVVQKPPAGISPGLSPRGGGIHGAQSSSRRAAISV
jgi:hypothetical protein